MKYIKEIFEDTYYEKNLFVAILVTTLAVIFIIAIAFGIFCLQAWFIMLLWNACVVSLLNIGSLTFWGAFGILLLIRLLMGKIGIKININND